MANVYLQDSTLTAIGNAIRTKGGTTAQLLPSEMPAAITNLPSGGGADPFNIYRGDSTIDNRLRYTGGQTSILLSDMGVNKTTFKQLRSVVANAANGKSVFSQVFTTRAIVADRAVTWEVYPKLAENVEYPDEVYTAVAQVFSTAAEIYPAVFACNNSITSSSTATSVWPILNGITGSAWQAMALGVVYNNRLYLGVFDYTTNGPSFINTAKYVIGAGGYIYWRY